MTTGIDKAKVWFLEVMTAYNNNKPEGAIIVCTKLISNVKYIHFHPQEMAFIPTDKIETFEGKQYVNSGYLMPILKLKYEFLFMIPHNNR